MPRAPSKRLVVALVRAAKDHDACKTWHVNESFVSLRRAKEMLIIRTHENLPEIDSLHTGDRV